MAVITATAAAGTALTAATIAAGVGATTAIAGAGMSFSQAAKQRRRKAFPPVRTRASREQMRI
jgi:Mn2+/Fe2+ NRAMP family transporter